MLQEQLQRARAEIALNTVYGKNVDYKEWLGVNGAIPSYHMLTTSYGYTPTESLVIRGALRVLTAQS